MQPYGQPQQGYYPPPPPGQQPTPQQGYAPPQHAGYHPGYAPPQQQGYAPPPQNGFAPQPPYGTAPPPPAPHAFAGAQQSYGAQPAYGAPPPPQQAYGGPVHTPQTYLGAPIHPCQNALIHGAKPDATQSVDGYNPAADVDAIHKATKGWGTKEKALNQALLRVQAVQLPVLVHAWRARHGKDLSYLIEKEAGGWYETALLALIKGPLIYDAHLVHRACAGAGTNEQLLNELVIGRTPYGLDMLKAAYRHTFHKDLDQTVLGELSLTTKTAFAVALLGNWADQPNNGRTPDNESTQNINSPVNHPMIQQDLLAIQHTLHSGNADAQLLASIIFARSPLHLYHLQQAFQQGSSAHAPLTRLIKIRVSGHLKEALVYALDGGKKDCSGCHRDAKWIHKAMAGAGTKDQQLIDRVLRAHWDKPRFAAVKQAYERKYKRLEVDIAGDTSGDFEDFLLEVCKS